LNDKQLSALKYLDLNPRMMLVLDDCTEKFSSWMKMFKKTEENIFESILYRGRHNFITLIFAAHDDKIVPTELRKNARVTKFGNSQALMASIGKAGNAYTTTEKKLAGHVANKVFVDAPVKGVKNYQKVCYVRDDPRPFQYTIANVHPDIRLGCPSLWALAEKMPKNDEKFSNNPFVKSLHMH
jgi:hypothetical protein